MNNSFIPTGDYLRQFLGHPMIKAKDLKRLLRNRGNFTSSNDKKILGPSIIKTGLSPLEFDDLKDLIQTKEETPKTHSRQYSWDSDECLLSVIEDNIDYESLIDDPFDTLKLINAPSFTLAGDGKDPDHVSIEFVLERNDKTKNFGDEVKTFTCSLEMKVEQGDLTLDMLMEHTSKESLNFINKFVKKTQSILEEKKCINVTYSHLIQFNHFTNKERINFFLELCKSNTVYLYGQEITKVSIIPDYDHELDIPEEIKWFEDKVKDLKLSGNKLDSSIFFKKPTLKEHLKIHSALCEYEINDNDHQGKCRVKYYFPEVEKNNLSELMIEVEYMSFDKKLQKETKSKLRSDILKFIEKKKMGIYFKHSSHAKDLIEKQANNKSNINSTETV
ncbi:hypothetical protein [Photobacterium leiognathi]|uniref:GapS4b family protein n=1 Tax=Photobacterium leiognathi TaxID=553611 RepID=UPI003AF3839C